MIKNESILTTAALQVGLIDVDTLNDLRPQARRERRSVLELLMRHYRFPESAFYQALAQQYELPYIHADQLDASAAPLARLSVNLLLRKEVLPVHLDGQLYLAMQDPHDRVVLDLVQRALGEKVLPAVAEPDALKYALASMHATAEEDEFDAVLALDGLMKQSYVRRASDIHIEPGHDFTRVRMRVDGMMQTLGMRLTLAETEALVNRIKVLSDMDISEQRLPQDGGLTYRVQDWDLPEMDIRVASIPTRWGERITMRILGAIEDALQLDQLGMPQQVVGRLKEVLQLPHGMLLVTGPTGSGKSTTLYACIRAMNANEKNILTVEDPVEQNLPGISQVQMTSKVNFSSALRSFLRHDPDVILVGEVRDLETAETALKASMTGHLVLSTLHTNNAISAVSRLVNLGCDRYLVGTTVVGIMAQRLVCRLCDHCKQPYEADESERALLGMDAEDGPVTLYKATGCPVCNGTGCQGRVGLYEALWVDHRVSDAIVGEVAEHQLRESENFFSLWDSARQRILDGEVSLEDVQHYHIDYGAETDG
ncbi:GspE/PulE family protein [Thiomicrorhabdus sp.]|uniref:GspE/PulE family protein n=1 Tax=Thiomicrorhabdus sp. TaxID=2039724 RepID=UPI0029C6DFF8|nr:GspE/PulE family protein [Thiomicrorhabdus sp.]